jgi:hypothetical protein
MCVYVCSLIYSLMTAQQTWTAKEIQQTRSNLYL